MPQNRAVILVNIIVAVSEVEFTTDGPPNLHTLEKKHGEEGQDIIMRKTWNYLLT